MLKARDVWTATVGYGTSDQGWLTLDKTEEDAKMAKLYFKYGAMGSSKSAQALITKFNYEELGMTVWLIKPFMTWATHVLQWR